MSERVRRRVVVRGRVQGVFFRDSTRREASRRGVCGWVCNRADGAVEAVFEGDIGEVERLVDWMQTGPPEADVDRIESFGGAEEGLTGFEVR